MSTGLLVADRRRLWSVSEHGAVIAFDVVVSFVLLEVIDLVIGLRVTEEAEIDGLDLVLNGEVVP